MDDKINRIKSWLGSGSINIFGLPFAGKDTQCNILAEYFNATMISGGDILRHAKNNTQVQNLMAKGEIIPSKLFESIVIPILSNEEYATKPLILSEVGRLEGEQFAVLNATEKSGHPTKAVILLDMPDGEVWKRFEHSQTEHDRGERRDDNIHVLQTRLDNYHDNVTPVLEYYEQQCLLVKVDGSQTKEAVTKEIINSLDELAGV